jgi:hypothetical protein
MACPSGDIPEKLHLIAAKNRSDKPRTPAQPPFLRDSNDQRERCFRIIVAVTSTAANEVDTIRLLNTEPLLPQHSIIFEGNLKIAGGVDRCSPVAN